MHSLFSSFHFCLRQIFHVEAAISAIKQNYKNYAELYPVIMMTQLHCEKNGLDVRMIVLMGIFDINNVGMHDNQN